MFDENETVPRRFISPHSRYLMDVGARHRVSRSAARPKQFTSTTSSFGSRLTFGKEEISRKTGPTP